jgi:hypothetical protein
MERAGTMVRSTLVLVAALAATFGCGNKGQPARESTRAIQSLADTRKALVSAKSQVESTLTAMNNLSGTGNLKTNFSRFTSAVDKTESDAARARKRAEEMRDSATQYISRWETEMQQVSNPELRASAAERRARVQSNFDDIQRTARETRDAYQPFMQDLQDVRKTLKVDLTPNGVQTVRPVMDKANADGRNLIQRLDALIAELDEVTAGMTPSGKAR